VVGVIAGSRKRALLIAGVASVLLWVVLAAIDRALQDTGGPSIVTLEFAGSLQRVVEISGEWGSHGVYLARLSLWIDFGFMFAYGAFLTLAALAIRDFARERNLGRLAAAGRVAPYLAVAAALLDVAENVTWLFLLGGHGGDLAAGFATACASLKFLCVSLAILYSIWGLVSWLRHRGRPVAQES
jgi:hypothetical protein